MERGDRSVVHHEARHLLGVWLVVGGAFRDVGLPVMPWYFAKSLFSCKLDFSNKLGASFVLDFLIVDSLLLGHDDVTHCVSP